MTLLWTKLVITVITSYLSDRDLSSVLTTWAGLKIKGICHESHEPSELHQTHLSFHSFHFFNKQIHQRDLHASLQWSISSNQSLQFYYLRLRHIQRFGVAKRNHYVKPLGLSKVTQNLPWGLNLLTSCTLILNVLEGNRCKKSCPSCFCRKTRTDGRTLPRLTQSWIFSSSLWTQEESKYHNHFYPNPGNKKRRNNHTT